MIKHKPNLILLNGPLGIGKSTLAKMYSERNPLALNIDLDLIRAHLGQWREYRAESARLSRRMAVETGRVAIKAGHDVVVAQILSRFEDMDLFEKLARDTQANLYEILLYAPKEAAVQRFIERGQAGGFEKGYSPGGLIDRSGGLVHVKRKYDEMMDLVNSRPQTVKINSISGAPEDTYAEILKLIKGSDFEI